MNPPFRVLYYNDLVNLLSCESPFHHQGEDFDVSMIDRSVDETGGLGVDAYFLQAGSGHLPLYPSAIYGMAEHVAWWKEHFGTDPLEGEEGSFLRWILDGGDVIARFRERVRGWGQAFFISQRLNDVHFAECAGVPGNRKGAHWLSRFYAGHLGDQLGDRTQYWFDWAPRALDWRNPEIPAYHLGLIKEQCERYDIDGFDLDFMRFPAFFAEDVPRRERVEILADFIAGVRSILDRTAKGTRRLLSARVPALRNKDEGIGIDLELWTRLGVDFYTVSSFYYTCQEVDFEETRRQAASVPLFLELTHATRVGEFLENSWGKTVDAFTFRRTTPFQYYTTAALGYAAGFDGAAVYNFQYYRPHGSGNRGPFNEPPFDILPRLGNPEMLGRFPQHYFLSGSHYVQHSVPPGSPPEERGAQLPRDLLPGGEISLKFRVLSEAGGPGVFRVETELPSDIQDAVEVRFNGVETAGIASLEEAFPFQMSPLTNISGRGAAWVVPGQSGSGTIEVFLAAKPCLGSGCRIVFADLSFRDARTNRMEPRHA
ncbi:MAG: hypothetical protein WC003_02085 [Terrimicrobiaceae bacterium]